MDDSMHPVGRSTTGLFAKLLVGKQQWHAQFQQPHSAALQQQQPAL
jgi:hypothetical protein